MLKLIKIALTEAPQRLSQQCCLDPSWAGLKDTPAALSEDLPGFAAENQ